MQSAKGEHHVEALLERSRVKGQHQYKRDQEHLCTAQQGQALCMPHLHKRACIDSEESAEGPSASDANEVKLSKRVNQT